MIKTLLVAGLLSTTVLSGHANADLSECGVNHSRLNPVELSDYQECWLDEFRGDDTSGVLGSLFWVNINDKYYSAPISTLRWDLGEAFKQSIVDDQISVAQQQAIRDAIAQLESRIETADEVRDIIADQTTDLTEYKELVKQHEMTIEDLEDEISKLMMMLEDPKTWDAGYTAGFEAGVASVDITTDNAAAYDLGYEAGKESVDITSDNSGVYDEGFNAGFAAGEIKGLAEAHVMIRNAADDASVFTKLPNAANVTINGEYTATLGADGVYVIEFADGTALMQAQADLSAANISLAAANASVASLTAQLATANADIAAKTTEITTLKADLSNAQADAASKTAMLNTKIAELATEVAAKNALQIQLNDANTELAALKAAPEVSFFAGDGSGFSYDEYTNVDDFTGAKGSTALDEDGQWFYFDGTDWNEIHDDVLTATVSGTTYTVSTAGELSSLINTLQSGGGSSSYALTINSTEYTVASNAAIQTVYNAGKASVTAYDADKHSTVVVTDSHIMINDFNAGNYERAGNVTVTGIGTLSGNELMITLSNGKANQKVNIASILSNADADASVTNSLTGITTTVSGNNVSLSLDTGYTLALTSSLTLPGSALQSAIDTKISDAITASYSEKSDDWKDGYDVGFNDGWEAAGGTITADPVVPEAPEQPDLCGIFGC